MHEEIFDVIMQITGNFSADIHTFQENRPPEENVALGEKFWIGRLPYGIKSQIVLDACDPAGFNFRPIRQYGMRYAFCHQVSPDTSNFYSWDHDLTIGRTIFISRLIRPTTIANCYSARLFFEDQQLKTIVAGPTQNIGAYAFVVAKDDWRDWLSIPEVIQLRNLSAIYALHPIDRIRRARKHVNNAFHAYYLDQRFASLVTSFESLLKVSDYKSTKQFATRAPKLAEMLGLELTYAEAEAMYKDRSAFVHGSDVSFNEFSDDLIEQYNRFERVIRHALLRASTEPDFANLFSSPESIRMTFGE